MKIYEQKVSRNVSVSLASIFSIILYIGIVIILNLLQELLDPTGSYYSVGFGILQFLAVTVYWILVCFLFFSRDGSTGTPAIVLFLVLNVLPILVYTIISSVLIVSFPTTDFALSWNYLTWIIGPTLFWYLPYSYPYLLFGEYLAFPIFMAIFLLYQILLEGIGIILGLFVRSTQEEKARQKLKERRETALRRRPQISFEQGRDFTLQTDTIDINDIGFGSNPFQPEDESDNTGDILPVTEDILRTFEEREKTEVLNRQVNEFSRNMRRSVTESHTPEETIEFNVVEEEHQKILNPNPENFEITEEDFDSFEDFPFPASPSGFENILKDEGILKSDESLKGKPEDQQSDDQSAG